MCRDGMASAVPGEGKKGGGELQGGGCVAGPCSRAHLAVRRQVRRPHCTQDLRRGFSLRGLPPEGRPRTAVRRPPCRRRHGPRACCRSSGPGLVPTLCGGRAGPCKSVGEGELPKSAQYRQQKTAGKHRAGKRAAFIGEGARREAARAGRGLSRKRGFFCVHTRPLHRGVLQHAVEDAGDGRRGQTVAGQDVARDADAAEIVDGGRRRPRGRLRRAHDVGDDVGDGHGSLRRRVLDCTAHNVHKVEAVEAGRLSVVRVVEQQHLAGVAAAHNLVADPAEQQHGHDARPERADAVHNHVAAAQRRQRAQTGPWVDLLAVGRDVEQPVDRARQRRHVAGVLLEVQLRRLERRVDGVAVAAIIVVVVVVVVVPIIVALERPGPTPRDPAPHRRADKVLHGAARQLPPHGARPAAAGLCRRVRDLALSPDKLAVLEHRRYVVGEVRVETPAHADVLVDTTHAADELDGAVKVPEKETGAREKEVAHTGQLEAEGEPGPLVNLHVHVDEKGLQQHPYRGVDLAPEGVRPVDEQGPLVFGGAGRRRQPMRQQLLHPPHAGHGRLVGNQAYESGADVAYGTAPKHTQDL